MIQEQWNPAAVGEGFEFTPILKPLEPFREHLNILSGLAHLQADTFGDGTGDHPRASAVWLTGVHAWDRTRPGVEVGWRLLRDQLAAREIGKDTQAGFARDEPRQSHAGRLRFGRLLLRQHRFLAQ